MGLALITGGASGLGLAMASMLAAEGYDLFLLDRDVEGLAAAAASLETEGGGELKTLCLDLGRDGAADIIFPEIEEVPDILINNAGFGVYGCFAETPETAEYEMLQVHVLNLTRLTKHVVREMLERGSGRILNISSLAALQPGPLMNVYYASKAYIYSFSMALAREVRGTGVSVSVVLPGLFNSGFAAATASKSGAAEKKEKHQSSSVAEVAAASIAGMMRGKSRIIPGWKNKVMAFFTGFLPHRWSMEVLYRAQVRIRRP